MTATHDIRSEETFERQRGWPQAGVAAPLGQRCDPECRDDHQIVRMRQAFRATGGLLSFDEVVKLFQGYAGPDAAVLAQWIRIRAAIAFEWQQETWLPMFQFSRKALSVHQPLRPVLRNLSAIYDGWETASWFALPNTWLTGRAPVDMLATDLLAVCDAARIDCFIALGEANWEKRPTKSRLVDLRAGMLTNRDTYQCQMR